MSFRPLTARQAEILAFIRGHIAERGLPPTREEIARAFGFLAASAEEHLRALARKGVLQLAPGTARGIRLETTAATAHASTKRRDPERQHTLPLIGQVAAGAPLLALAHIERQVVVDPTLFRRADYLLRVRGMSMRDAGIHDADLLAVRQTPEARDRQIVVARLDDEVTVKRFERRGTRVRLLPENPDFHAIEIDLRRQPLSIEGVAVGVLRIFSDAG